MRSETHSNVRYFILLIIAFLIAFYQIYVFNREIYVPQFYNSSDNF